MRHARCWTWLAAAASWAALTAPAAGVTHLKRGMTAPPIELSDLEGVEIGAETLAGHTVVLLFGELYNEKTRAASAQIQAALESEELAGRGIVPLLIVAQSAPRAELRESAAEAGVRWRVAHDADRRVFGVYRVAVLPSLVVVDRDGRVVHAVAGYIDRFGDQAIDAVRVSEGLLSAEDFERSLHPAPAGMTETQTRAARLTSLARQLVRRGMSEVAEEKFAEALALEPAYAPARLGLGALHVRRGRLAEAELEYRAILAAEPSSLDARLGLASVQALRGGDEIEAAETALRSILASNPGEPRAQYLMGIVHRERGELEEAAASFQAAAELLMHRCGSWDAIAEEGTP